MSKTRLKLGFREARKITRKFAKTFYLASLLLPAAKKNASYCVYAICRLSDETVDGSKIGRPQEELEQLRQKIALAYSPAPLDDPLLEAFRQTLNDYALPQEYFDELLKGMQMDLEQKRFADFDALYTYCYRVAGVVGLIMLKIFGSNSQAAADYAVKLGVAMQLTNILRDIREDLCRGRIYLPQAELEKFNISEQQLSAGSVNQEFKQLMRFQISRACRYYTEGLTGIKLVQGRSSRLVILAMAENYRQILEQIQKNNFDVFTKRAQVSLIAKLFRIGKILAEGKYR